MAYDGSLKFDTKIDSSGFESGVKKLKGLAVGAGASVAAGLGSAISKGISFESKMSSVRAISGSTADEMEKLSAKAKEMGIKTVFSATDAGQAMEYMAMAGWKTGEMLSGISGIMDLAAASGEDLGSVSDIVTDALTAFGLKAADSGRFADVLAAASSNANTNVSMMGETFKYAAPVAGALGFSIEDTAKAIGLMANAGIKGSQAGTALRSIITRIAKPTKESQTAMDKLGVSITDSSGNMKSFDDIMKDVRAGMSKLTADEKAAYAAMLGGQEAMSGLLAIANASEDDFNKLGNAINNSAGAAKEMSEVKLDNLKGQLTLMGSAAEGLGIAIYEGIEGPLKNAVSNGTQMISDLAADFSGGELREALGSLGDFLGGAVTGGIRLAASALPLLTSGIQVLSSNAAPLAGIFLTGASAITGFKAAVTITSTATSLFSAATAALTNPIGMVGAALGVGALAFIGIKNAVAEAETKFYNMGDALDITAQKYQAAKDKAAITEDYAQRWRDLNKAIEDGTLSGTALKDAEAERKGIEEWFIQNYGQYISAEEAKNGIRADTVSKLQEQVRLLSEMQRLELENQVLETKRKIPDLTSKLSSMKNENSELEIQNKKLLENNNVILKATMAWNSLTDEQKMSGDYDKLYFDILDKINGALGTRFKVMDDVDKALAKNEKTIESNNSKMEDNRKNIEDAVQSLQSYADTCRTLIESALGDTLEGFAEKFDLIKKAQDEINTSGEISAETFDALIKKFPEMEDSLKNAADAPQAIAEKMGELQTQLDNAKQKAADFGTELNGLPKEITIDIKLNVPDVPQFARGTKGASEGPAIVNDGNGPELIRGKDGSLRMVSSGGAALTWLNSGDRVYTAEQTRAMLRNVPHYASGVGNKLSGSDVYITAYIDKLPEEFEKALDNLKLQLDLDVIERSKYFEELAKLRDEYLQKGSDKWWEYTKEIISYEQEAADELRRDEFKQLDRQLRRRLISDEEYYIRLEELRDKYYSAGSDEWEDYTDKLYEHAAQQADKARDAEFEALDKALSRRFISEKEYYIRLEELRDKYFSEGSDEWKSYTDKIIDYNVGKINEIVDSVKSKASEIKSGLLSGLSTFSIDTVTIQRLPGAKTQIAGRPPGDFSGADLTKQVVNLQNLKDYRENMQMYYDAVTELSKTEQLSDEFYSYLLSKSMDEGYGLARQLLSMSDEDRRGFLDDWDNLQSLSGQRADSLAKGIANRLYSDSVRELVTESADSLSNDFITELSKYFDDIPEEYYNIGAETAKSFADGFSDSIRAAGPVIDKGLWSFGRTINNFDYRSTVINAGNNASAHDIIEANYQNEIYQNHTKGW